MVLIQVRPHVCESLFLQLWSTTGQLMRFIAAGFSNNDGALKCLTIRFWDFPKPSICAVNGLAVGGAAAKTTTGHKERRFDSGGGVWCV